jgi:hypothetical protein
MLTQVNPAEAVWHLGEASPLESPRYLADLGAQQLPCHRRQLGIAGPWQALNRRSSRTAAQTKCHFP